MIFLTLHVLLNVVFALSTRVAQAGRYDYFFIATVNYVLAAVVATIWAVLSGSLEIDQATLIFGAVQGIQYAGTMVGVYWLLMRSGVGVTFILLRLSVVIPTAVSIVVFGERPGPIAIMGLTLLLVSIPLLAGSRTVVRGERSGWYWPSIIGLLVFTGAGIAASKAFNELSEPSHAPMFVCVAFVASVPVAVGIYMCRYRLQPDLSQRMGGASTARPWVIGAIMGTANVVQLTFLVAALDVLPGTIVFPIQTSAAMLLTTAAGMLYWRERHGLTAGVGVLTAVIGMGLVNV